MVAFASLLIASALSVASLNLCSDEYLLLLARPGEVASVTHLAHDPRESALWHAARRYPANRGTIEDVIAYRPRLVITVAGNGGRNSSALAGRIGARVVTLRSPTSIADVAVNLRATAAALGDPRRADPWLARIAALQRRRPRRAIDTIFLSGGGLSLYPGSPGIEWMRLAGLSQRALPTGRADLETLLTAPPRLLLASDYRRGQVSAGERWLSHPIVRHLKSVKTDGRAWTCTGPLMIEEIERLQRLVR